MKTSLSNILTALASVLILSFITSCGESPSMREMDRADAVVDQHPDSALTILGAIDASSLSGSEEKARHSLLSALAMLKTSAECDYDSIFAPAWAYYGKKDTPSRETMLTHYVKAYTHILNSDDTLTLYEYDRAIALAPPDCKIYEGMSYINKGLIYAGVFQGKGEIENLTKGLACIRESNDSSRLGYALACMASGYLHNNRDSEALVLIEEGLALPQKYLSDSEHLLLRDKANAELNLGHSEEAIHDFERFMNRFPAELTYGDSLGYVNSLLSAGNIKEAGNFLFSLSEPGDDEGRYTRYYLISRLSEITGENYGIMDIGDSLLHYENKVLDQKLNKDLSVSLLKMEEKEKNTHKILSRQRMVIIVGICALAMILLVIFTLVVHRVHTSMKRRGNEDLAAKSKEVEEARAVNISLEKRISDLIQKHSNGDEELRKVTAYSIELKEKVATLERQQTDLLDKIDSFKVENYTRYGDTCRMLQAFFLSQTRDILQVTSLEGVKNKVLEKVLKEVREHLLSPYRDKEFLGKLENSINHITGNMLEKLEIDLKLTYKDKQALIFDFCGFDYVMIGEITGVNPASASSRKTRLRRKIQQRGGEYARSLVPFFPLFRE